MSTTLAAILAVGAVLGVLYVTKKQEAATAMKASSIAYTKNSAVLSGSDTAAGIVAGVATYYGGPAAGRTTLNLFGKRA